MRRAAVTLDKLRNNVCLVGIDVRPQTEKSPPVAVVGLARRWKIEDITRMVSETAKLYAKFQWDTTYVELESGDYLITMLKRAGIPVKVVTTQKKVKEARKIQRIKVMDSIEMTEFLRALKLNGQIKWVKNPSKEMQEMEEEIPYFSKHTTEAGATDYYASGKEPDGLVRGLRLSCFSARKYLQAGDTGVICGTIPRPNKSFDIGTQIEAEFAATFPNTSF